MADQKGWLNVVPGPKARYSLFFSDPTLISVALFSTGGGGGGTPARLGQGATRHRSNRHAGVLALLTASSALLTFRTDFLCFCPKTNMYFGTWERRHDIP